MELKYKYKNNLFAKNRKGVSAVIATALLIGIVIVSIAVVWGVIKNILDDRTSSASCLDTFEKVVIEDYYTCYNLTAGELKVSIERKDLDVESIVVAVYGKSQSQNFELPSTGYTYVRNYGGAYGGSLNIPNENSAVTYVVNITELGLGSDLAVKISPTIEDTQCEVSDSIMNVENC